MEMNESFCPVVVVVETECLCPFCLRPFFGDNARSTIPLREHVELETDRMPPDFFISSFFYFLDLSSLHIHFFDSDRMQKVDTNLSNNEPAAPV